MNISERINLVKEWLRLGPTRYKERKALVRRAVSESNIIPRAIAKLRGLPDNAVIESKTIEIEKLRRQVADMRAQASALDTRCAAVKARVIALKQREEQIILDQATVPARAAAIVESLGFDISSKEKLNRERIALKQHEEQIIEQGFYLTDNRDEPNNQQPKPKLLC